MHQPLVWTDNKLENNLKLMIESKDSRENWNGKLIARAYKNPAKYVRLLKDFDPKIVVDFSGVLLESLMGMTEFLDGVYVQEEKIGDVIGLYREVLKKMPNAIEFAGTAYAHCYFPTTPIENWRAQVEEWRGTFKRLFGARQLSRISGFWFPEMGLPAFEENLAKLIKIVRDAGYEWCILPLQVVKGYERLSYERRIRIFATPHRLKAGNEEITAVFRVPTYFLDQQAGMRVNDIVERAEIASKLVGYGKPALLITASDGENGNVMMNEFFPKTFEKFFTDKKEVGSMLVTEFLQTYYSNAKLSEIRLKVIGGSWINGHHPWLHGTGRWKRINRLYRVSKMLELAKPKMNKKEFMELRKLLLIAETSCYVYWGTKFWFGQGKKALNKLEQRLKKILG